MNPLTDIRKQIDRLDSEILTKIEERLEYCRLASQHKDQIFDPQREEQVRKLWFDQAAELHLSPSFANDLLSLILTESKRMQSEVTTEE